MWERIAARGLRWLGDPMASAIPPAVPAAPEPAVDPVAGADVFDDPTVAWNAVSPKLKVARRAGLAVVVAVVVGVVALLASTLTSVIWVGLVVPAVLAGWGWWLVGRNWSSWGWAERDEDLLVRRGYLFRSLVVVPYGRMQVVDVEAGPVARALGYASVKLVTASARTDAVVHGVPHAEATRLRDRLSARGEAQAAGL